MNQPVPPPQHPAHPAHETRQAARTGVAAGPRPVPGPRQEYVDAFEDESFGRRGRRGGAAGAPSPHRAAGNGRGHRAGSAPPGDSKAGERRRREGWGRTLTGVASAAVVTVLAVVAAVQVADPDAGDEADSPSLYGNELPGGGVEAPQAGPSAPAEREPAAEPGYEELLDTTFDMAPDLTGSGELVPVGGSDPPADPDAATLVRYRVDVEEGIGMNEEFFAEAVQRILNDERGWGNGGERSFARVSAGDYDFVITLASPGTTADWCARSGLDTMEDNVSCNSSSTERVMINAWRWSRGSETYGDDIRGYRQMLVNHEVGHRLGYGHVTCPGEGALAPVMMQQTKFLTTDGVTCEPNPWPHPENGN
jgi:uncharacterized protein DUF3152